jgi:hypothetical protein
VRRLALLSLTAAVILAGCGNTRTPAPDTGAIPPPTEFREVKYSIEGIALKVPANWRLINGSGTQLATVAIGDAQIAIWRYARTEPLPVTRSQLHAARQALVQQIERRDATFELTSSRLVIKPGLRAVEIVGQGTNHGEKRSVRSLHAYGHGAEVVVDAFSPPEDFARVDMQTFAAVARSLRLSRPEST